MRSPGRALARCPGPRLRGDSPGFAQPGLRLARLRPGGLYPAALTQVTKIDVDGYDAPSSGAIEWRRVLGALGEGPAAVDRCGILGVFGERRNHSLVDQAGERPIASCGLHPQGMVDIDVEIDRGALVIFH